MSKQRRLTTSPVAAAAPEDDWGVSKDDLHASLMVSLFSRPFHVTDPMMNARRLHCTTLLILSELPSLPNGGQTLRQNFPISRVLQLMSEAASVCPVHYYG